MSVILSLNTKCVICLNCIMYFVTLYETKYSFKHPIKFVYKGGVSKLSNESINVFHLRLSFSKQEGVYFEFSFRLRHFNG